MILCGVYTKENFHSATNLLVGLIDKRSKSHPLWTYTGRFGVYNSGNSNSVIRLMCALSSADEKKGQK